MEPQHVRQLREDGYAVIRGFLSPEEIAPIYQAVDDVHAEAMTHHATYRDKNLCFELLNDPDAGRKVVLQAYWFAWINAVLEAQRRHPRYLEVLEPLLGRDIKQIANQIHWKPPGAKYSSYRFHQDMRFRQRPELFSDLAGSYFTTGLAVDRVDAENGALQVFPGSHRLGYLGLADESDTIMKGRTTESELADAGLNLRDAVVLELEPGDLAIWTLLTVHGSDRNRSDRERRFILNSYVRAEASPHRGEWAFRDGQSVPLGDEPQICRFEDMPDHQEPFYIEEDWTGEQFQA